MWLSRFRLRLFRLWSIWLLRVAVVEVKTWVAAVVLEVCVQVLLL
jgi:hypothetical protein